MSGMPPLLGDGRARTVAVVAGLAVGQAAAAGLAAFATRDVFAALGAAEAPLPLAAFAILVAAGLTVAVLRVGERTAGEHVGQRYAAALRKALFKHLMRMPAGAVAQRRSGALAIRFVGDLTAVRAWVSQGVTRLISAAIVIPGAIAALFLLNPALATAAAVPLALSILTMAMLAPRLSPLHGRLRAERTRLAVDMTERVPVAPELRLLGRGALEMELLDQRAGAVREAAVERTRMSAILRAVPEIGASVAGVALLGVAFLAGASPPEAAGALATLAILAAPLRDLATIWDRRQAWAVARDKCQAILDQPIIAQPKRTLKRAAGRPAKIEIRAAAVGPLDGVTMTAEPGEKIAVVGGNGVGKSTLLAVLAGLEPIRAGQVLIDGIDLAAFSTGDRRQTIAYVGPRSPILRGTLRRALTLGITPRPSDDRIEAAAWAFGLGPVLDRLGGLDGSIAENGRNLSSGEARRVHLVRAALAEPDLLLLDEPDDAMDRDGRAVVKRLIRQTKATTLVVTHDRSLAAELDLVWNVARDGVRKAVAGEIPDRNSVGGTLADGPRDAA